MSLGRPKPGEAPRTRIKLCGFTREADVDAAVALGIDAIGFVFYPPSPRYVTPARAAALAARVPSTIARVGLVVDQAPDAVRAIVDAVPLDLLQLHGDETPDRCAAMPLPWIKAARVAPGLDLLEFARLHAAAEILLLDTHSAGYGGSGIPFDWSLVPPHLVASTEPRVMLGGGLHVDNVAAAIARIRPFAVDTSSGIESAKGIKDAGRMAAFVAAVRQTDQATARTA